MRYCQSADCRSLVDSGSASVLLALAPLAGLQLEVQVGAHNSAAQAVLLVNLKCARILTSTVLVVLCSSITVQVYNLNTI